MRLFSLLQTRLPRDSQDDVVVDARRNGMICCHDLLQSDASQLAGNTLNSMDGSCAWQGKRWAMAGGQGSEPRRRLWLLETCVAR